MIWKGKKERVRKIKGGRGEREGGERGRGEREGGRGEREGGRGGGEGRQGGRDVLCLISLAIMLSFLAISFFMISS